MAKDIFGRFFIAATVDAPRAKYAWITVVHQGDGAPDDLIGRNGHAYVDKISGAFYTKANGVWAIVGAFGGGNTTAIFISTPNEDPNSVYSATRPAFAYDSVGSLWIKTNAGTNNTGWEQRL